jgi:type I restriction enzyme, R subunit
MPDIGELERRTQQRVVRLFREKLGYAYLGNWIDRLDNANIEPRLLAAWLEARGIDEVLVARALREVDRAAGDASKSLHDRNRDVYGLLRYGAKVRPAVGENMETVWLIDWKHPDANDFAIAEEVAIAAKAPGAFAKRPDVVLYVNGIALAVLELKRSTISVSEGIRQNLDSQKKEFIEHFFSTMQWVMAGNDTEGLRYGTIQTPEKYYLAWKEEGPDENRLDKALSQVCAKARFLELVHDFIVFDAGTKKLCRHSQYFGVRAAQAHVNQREGGIIWHTQGSGKSLVMVWLAKWIREHVTDARVLIITDRTELDGQIENVFLGVDEEIYRTRSGADVLAKLNAPAPWLLCSLIHKFRGPVDDERGADPAAFIEEIRNLPPDFRVKGDLYVFVDECHRTQSGELHDEMKVLLPGAVFIGFTGTPLLKSDKRTSLERFGKYIHTYKFDEAVKDGVVLDLRYEARDIPQEIRSPEKIDAWFDAKTRGLTDLAKAQLRARWGTMQKVFSSQSRLEQIAADILMDMATKDRLSSGHGNAMLVAGSIYQACQLYALFAKTDLKGKCAIVTSYNPSPAAIKGEEAGEGLTERLQQYEIYKQMLSDWFREPPDTAINRIEAFEKAVIKTFVHEPGQMKLLIVVDMLLTGFDAPPATYLYIDKQMRDHGLFQAICRVNRLDDEDKEYGYVVDYKDLFKSLESAMHDYTSGALDGYDKDDVAGLLKDRVAEARKDLEAALDAVRLLCEPVELPKNDEAYYRFFSSTDPGDAAQLKANEPRRLALYKTTAMLVRTYAALAPDMTAAGYSDAQAAAAKAQVSFYENLRSQVKLHSGDAIDLKLYEPAMRHLIDTYISASASQTVSAFENLSLVQLIVERGAAAVDALPEGIRRNPEAVAETIQNNVRRLIIDESPVNPKYYEKMSQLLDALIELRRKRALEYKDYLAKLVELARQAQNGPEEAAYPKALDTPAKRALFDNLDRNETVALMVDRAVRDSRQDDWRSSPLKTMRVRLAISNAVATQPPGGVKAAESKGDRGALVERLLELVKNQSEY